MLICKSQSISLTVQNDRYDLLSTYHAWYTKQLLDESRFAYASIPANENANSLHMVVSFARMVLPEDGALVRYGLRPKTAEVLLERPAC